jgi:hypothetical protein
MNSNKQSAPNPKDYLTPATDAFVEAYANDSLMLDCPSITLRQNIAKNPMVISGRGSISLLGSETFQLRLYADGASKTPHPLSRLLKTANWKSGEIIPSEEYFALEAIDISGFAWSCKKLDITAHDYGHGTVITGRLYDALIHRSSGLTPTLPPDLSMFFFEDLPVPFNNPVFIERKMGGQILSGQIQMEFAKFEAAGFTFKLEKTEAKKGSTILRAHADEGQFPEGIETRIEETLRYVTFSPIRWCVIDKFHAGVREVTVVPRTKQRKALFDEPLDHRRHDHAIDYWRLFSAYFQYTLTCTEPKNYHPLSAQLFHVIASETMQLDLTGLLVSIAAEGVLNVAFKELARPTDIFRASLDKVSKIIDRLKCADAGLAMRLRGAIQPMKSARPKDKLKLLVDSGVVTADMVKTWEKLRNTTAHASVRFDPTTTQTILSQCYTVYTMLNRLIFQAIEYSGKYQDFSTLGWPIDQFNVRVLSNTSKSE